ncbi:MAG TPA: hypothetical protein VMV19_17575 [Xanthobacteraceae bacterium]|nr:hypothetical protein [Xanthobacteraceae bacterium]
MASQFIPQGTLNRLRTSVTIAAFPELNVTAPFLGKRSVRLTRNGRIVENLQSLTGVVPSPEPYVMMEIHINLLKSQALANAYEQQLLNNAYLGQLTVRTDTATLQSFIIGNASIINVDELSFAGDTPDYMVSCEGQYLINSALWNS